MSILIKFITSIATVWSAFVGITYLLAHIMGFDTNTNVGDIILVASFTTVMLVIGIILGFVHADSKHGS